MHIILIVPTVVYIGSLQFRINTKENGHLGFPHVHVVGAGGSAVFSIETGECIEGFGFNKPTVRRIEKAVLKHQEQLQEAWDEFHTKED